MPNAGEILRNQVPKRLKVLLSQSFCTYTYLVERMDGWIKDLTIYETWEPKVLPISAAERHKYVLYRLIALFL